MCTTVSSNAVESEIKVGMRVGYEDDVEGIGTVVGEIKDVTMADYTSPGPVRPGVTDLSIGDVWIVYLDPGKRADDRPESMMMLIWKEDISLKPAKKYDHIAEIYADKIVTIFGDDGVQNLLVKGSLAPGHNVEVFIHTNRSTIKEQRNVG